MDTKQKGKIKYNQENILESLGKIVTQTQDTLKHEVFRGDTVIDQLLGSSENTHKVTGELKPGESLSMKDIFKEKSKLEEMKSQITTERGLLEEEKLKVQEKARELKLQLYAIIKEAKRLTDATQGLSKEVKIASVSAPIEPGIYHLIFFEKLLESIYSFRKKIENAQVWLSAVNKRAQKKNYWTSYKKSKGSFLLSAEHYLQRSAG